MEQFFHSVTLDKELCKGCINCVKRCPTEAIRVRDGKAVIMAERCIDCGECIRICPHHAKRATSDPLSILKQYPYTIALPAPSLYAQFANLEDIDLPLNALKKMGFDEVFEVSKAAELVSDATCRILDGNPDLPKPLISSACPAVLRLIRVRFPQLLPNVLKLNAPIEVAARRAKREAARKTGLPLKDIGAIFISPCPAKVTAVKMPLGTENSWVDAVVAIKDVYPAMLGLMKELSDSDCSELSDSGRMGISWCISGGEASALLKEQYLAADGIENVISVLEDLEDEKLPALDFVELNACSGGCVGGVLTVENPYVARVRLKQLRKYLPLSRNHIEDKVPDELQWDADVAYTPVLELDEDIGIAMSKLREMSQIEQRLAGIDCGSCGAPTCRALAEDIVRGTASEEQCIFKLREQVQSLQDELSSLQHKADKENQEIPPDDGQ